MPDEELQSLYAEAARRGMFKSDPDLQAIGHELRKRNLVIDPTQGGLVTPSQPKPAAPAKPAPNPLNSLKGFVDYASAPSVSEQIAPSSKPKSAPKPAAATLPAKPQADAMVRSTLKEQQAAQAREKKRKPSPRILPPWERPGLNAAEESSPSIVSRAAGAVGEALSTPSGILKAVVQPLETQALDALTKAGFGRESRSPQDIAEQKRVAALPFGQRVGVVKGQDWRTLGRTPETQMRKANQDRQGNTAEQVFGAIGQFLGDLAADPLTWASGGGSAIERKIVEKFPQAAAAAKVLNKAAGGAMAGQQLATGLPALESGVQSGDPRSILQGILSTIMGGLAAGHVTGATDKLLTGIENRRTAKTTAQRMEKVGRGKVGETLPGTVTPPSILLQNSLKNEIAPNAVAENAIRPTEAVSISQPSAEIPAQNPQIDEVSAKTEVPSKPLSTPAAKRQTEARRIAEEKVVSVLRPENQNSNAEYYILPQLSVQVGDKTELVPTSEIMKKLGYEAGDTGLNYWRKSLDAPNAVPETLPETASVAPADAQTPTQVTEPAKSKPVPSPAVSDMSQMRMRDVFAFAAEQGIALEDKANWKETHGDVINRAMGEYDNILHSLRQYDPTKNPQATPEERYVAAYRQREIKGELGAELDKPEGQRNQAKIDALLDESKRLSNLLYRTGSEAGRALQFQQVIIGDKLDVNSVLNRAEAMTDGKLSNPARRSLIGLASEAEKAKAAADAALQAKAEQAKKQVRTQTNKSAQATPNPEGIKQKLIGKLSAEDQARLDAAVSRIEQKRKNIGVQSDPTGAQTAYHFATMLPDMVEIGTLYLKAGVKTFGEWAAAMRGHVDSLDEGQMQALWAHTKEAMRKESNGQPAHLKPQTFADSIRQKLGSEKAVSFLDAIDDNGNHTILNKLMRGEDLTTAEKITVINAWKANAPQRGKGSGQLGAVQALSEIVKEGRQYTPPTPKPLTAESLQERAQKTLANLGKPATPRAKPTVPQALMAEWEYAQGARDLNTFARRIQAQMGGKMEQAQIDALFAEAVKRYTADYKQLDEIKNQMAKVIRDERYKQKTPLGKASYWTGEGLQAVTSLKATLDLSGWLRQGGIMAISRPGVGAAGFRKMIAAAQDEGTANAINQAILNGPNGELYKKSGLALVDQSENAPDWQRDEQFVSKMIGKIPGFGKLHEASERAYTTVGNVMRAKLFDELYEPGMTDAEANDLARYINVVSGRADLSPQVAMSMPALAKAIWSPRYAISRVQYLIGQPLLTASTMRTRKIIAQEYGRYLYKIALVGYLAAQAGAKVETDRRSKDFGTIRFGRVEIDPTSGLKQYVRAVSQLPIPGIGTGQTKDAEGKVTQTDEKALLGTFARGKANPGAGLIYDMAIKRPNKAGQRTDPTGDPYTVGKVARSAVLPITIDNVIEGMTKFGVNETTARDLATSTLLDVFGVSTNVRDREQEAQQRRLEKRQNARRR